MNSIGIIETKVVVIILIVSLVILNATSIFLMIAGRTSIGNSILFIGNLITLNIRRVSGNMIY